jgi:hypothetical protein
MKHSESVAFEFTRGVPACALVTTAVVNAQPDALLFGLKILRRAGNL